MIKSGIPSKSERTKEMCTCDCETNREEMASSTYYNEGKEKTFSTPEKK